RSCCCNRKGGSAGSSWSGNWKRWVSIRTSLTRWRCDHLSQTGCARCHIVLPLPDIISPVGFRFSMLLRRAWFIILLLSILPLKAMAHGGVAFEDDRCVINIGFLTAHFTIYQPHSS